MDSGSGRAALRKCPRSRDLRISRRPQEEGVGGKLQALWEGLLTGSHHPIGDLSLVFSACRGRRDPMVP